MLATCSEMRDVAQTSRPFSHSDITNSAVSCIPPHLPAVAQTMVTLARDVAAAHGITVDDIRGHKLSRQYSIPRHEFCWRARAVLRSDGLFRYSLPQIGRFLNGRDHSSVWHAVRRHAERLRVAQLAEVKAANEASVRAHGDAK